MKDSEKTEIFISRNLKEFNLSFTMQIEKKNYRERDAFSRLYNARIDYYRQLQRISDSVTLRAPPKDLERERADLLIEEQALELSIVKQVGRKRYLANLMEEEERRKKRSSLASTDKQFADESLADSATNNNAEGDDCAKERDCGICKLEFDKGAMTPCGHLFCEGN